MWGERVPLHGVAGPPVPALGGAGRQARGDHLAGVVGGAADLGVLPALAQVLPAPLGVGLEAARGQDHGFGAQFPHGPVPLAHLHPAHRAVLDDQPEHVLAVADLGAELLGDRDVVVHQALAAVDVSDMQPAPEQVGAVLALVGLALVHQPVLQPERLQPAQARGGFLDQDLRQFAVAAPSVTFSRSAAYSSAEYGGTSVSRGARRTRPGRAGPPARCARCGWRRRCSSCCRRTPRAPSPGPGPCAPGRPPHGPR